MISLPPFLACQTRTNWLLRRLLACGLAAACGLSLAWLYGAAVGPGRLAPALVSHSVHLRAPAVMVAANRPPAEGLAPAATSNFSITKRGQTTVFAGALLTYTIAVTTSGANSSGSIIMTDTLPPGVVFVSRTPPSGWTCAAQPVGQVLTCTRASAVNINTTHSFVILVTAPITAGNIVNTAYITNTGDNIVSNNLVQFTTTVVALADLGVTKSVSPSPVYAGQPLTYQVTITNAGPSISTQLLITDTLPVTASVNGFTYTSGLSLACQLAANVLTCQMPALSTQVSAIITVWATAATASPLVNRVVVTSTNVTDPKASNNTAIVTTTVNAAANLSVGLSGGPTPIQPGVSLRYTVTVTNSGPSPAAGVMFTSTLAGPLALGQVPPGCVPSAQVVTCSLGVMPTGAVTAVTFVVTPTVSGVFTHSVKVGSAVYDPDPANTASLIFRQHELMLPVILNAFCTPREIEPNNSFADANRNGPLCLEVGYHGNFEGIPGTFDLFLVTFTQGGLAIFTLTGDSDAGVQLVLYNSAGTQVQYQPVPDGVGDFVISRAVAAEYFYIYVYGAPGVANTSPYTLTVHQVTADAASGQAAPPGQGAQRHLTHLVRSE